MKLIADINVLVRAIVGDDATQARRAQAELREAELVAIAIPTLCELVWVLMQGYKVSLQETADVLERLIGSANVVVNRPTAEAGLVMLRAGGDFADGVIAHEGQWLGGECFLSFDRKAVKLLKARGQKARAPGKG